MTLPNFFIVGAAKSGTTSLYHYLDQHPDIFMSRVKEPHYFVDWDKYVKNLEGYEALFAAWNGERAVGEASTGYLYDSSSPARIKELVPHAKIIILLRNPAEMAFTLWRHMRRLGKRGEHKTFRAALKAENARLGDHEFKAKNQDSWHGNFYYYNRALYYPQVKRYYDTFGKSNVHVIIFEEFAGNPIEKCREVFRYLGVDESFMPSIDRFNVGREVRHRGLQKLICNPPERIKALAGLMPGRVRNRIKETLLRINAKKAPTFEPSIKEELLANYRSDVEKLEKLLGRKLSIWYSR